MFLHDTFKFKIFSKSNKVNFRKKMILSYGI